MAVCRLEDRIARAVARIGGEHDGNELGEGQAILYTYGPDADAILEAVRQSLADFPVRADAYAIKRYGRADDPAATEQRVELS